ncbi:MAG: 6-carboxytetrahydropterin synthase [Gammaproteobacteria bacterium]|nr:6-carboxytetrahydropterin synthase [Gammaproteobacteria bacterium]
MTILFVNRLTVIDASLLDPLRGLLGQSWYLDVELEGSLDHQGMVLDFGEVKKQIKRCVDSEFDHRLLIPAAYSGCRIEDHDGRRDVYFQLASGARIEHRGPADACAPIDAERIDETTLATAIQHRLKPILPDNVLRISANLHAEEIVGASYQYSHGLKHHEGNCQRIAHGHRSRIYIFRDGRRSPELESDWAQRWKDSYLGTKADLKRKFTLDRTAYYHFGYISRQGGFELILPKRSCYLIDTDSTVENLARHICTILKREHPASEFRVAAFEGVDKGSISEC